VSHKKKSAGRIGQGGAAETRHDGRAAGNDGEKLRMDAFFFQDSGNVFCGGILIARGIRGVDLEEIGEPGGSLAAKRCGIPKGWRSGSNDFGLTLAGHLRRGGSGQSE
jgi:hypothetical protein